MSGNLASRVDRRTIAPLGVSRSRSAIGLILASTGSFALCDAATKHLCSSLPANEVAWLRYLAFVMLIAPSAALATRASSRSSLDTPYTPRIGIQVARALAMVGSALLFTSSLKYLSLADATAINFVYPIFVAALSARFLGERVGVRRWIAAAVGLIGVVLILRPGSGVFTPAAVLPVASAMLWACAVVLTRHMGLTERTTATLTWSAAIGLAALTPPLLFDWTTPTLLQIAWGFFIGLTALIGQFFMIQAYRRAEASVVAPFTYAKLLIAGMLGFVLFGAVPNVWSVLGAITIVGSGLYLARAEDAAVTAQHLPT